MAWFQEVGRGSLLAYWFPVASTTGRERQERGERQDGKRQENPQNNNMRRNQSVDPGKTGDTEDCSYAGIGDV